MQVLFPFAPTISAPQLTPHTTPFALLIGVGVAPCPILLGVGHLLGARAVFRDQFVRERVDLRLGDKQGPKAKVPRVPDGDAADNPEKRKKRHVVYKYSGHEFVLDVERRHNNPKWDNSKIGLALALAVEVSACRDRSIQMNIAR